MVQDGVEVNHPEWAFDVLSVIIVWLLFVFYITWWYFTRKLKAKKLEIRELKEQINKLQTRIENHEN